MRAGTAARSRGGARVYRRRPDGRLVATNTRRRTGRARGGPVYRRGPGDRVTAAGVARRPGRVANRPVYRRGAGERVVRRGGRPAARRAAARGRPVHAVRRPPGKGYRHYRRGRFHRHYPRWKGPRRYWRGYYWRPAFDGWYYWSNDIWWWAPALGVITGIAIAADAAAYDTAVVDGADAAWTPEWYAYCARRYRSFDPNTGYYLGYDGEYHFCVYRG